jgi:hypothetical protein
MGILISPAFAFEHPSPPPTPKCPEGTFAVKIRDQWCYDSANPFEFTEPEDNFCDDVKVTVLAYNVTDLYGYEFTLTWNSTYFALKSWKIEKVWEPQYLVYNATDDNWFKAAVVAQRPAVGVTKPEVLLVTLTFHIVNDVCWPQCEVSGVFELNDIKASDSCTEKINLCDPLQGYWCFIAKEPEVYIEPEEQINCVVGEKVTYSVWVYNITKMKSLHFDLRWSGNHIVTPAEDIWLPILNITKKDVVINEEVFPKANRTSSIQVENMCGANQTFRVVVDIVMECTYPLINGTFKAVDLTFTKMDPWWCGRQPNYTRTDHVWTPDNATTPLWFEEGWIDVRCPDLKYIYFGKMQEIGPILTQPAGYPPFDYYPARFWVDIYGDCKTEWILQMLGNSTPWVGDGHWGIDLVISFDGITPAYKIHNNDGWNAAWPWGTWLYSPWVDGIGFDPATTKTVSSLTWVHCTGDRYVTTNPGGWFTITIDKGKLGFQFYYAIWVGVGGFYLPNTGYSSYPKGFDWNYPYWIPPYSPMEVVAKASYNEAKFTFMPVSGDLTGDGKVDISDLLIIAGKYGYEYSIHDTFDKWYKGYYYDFTKDGVIDIFDIIVVTKNFGAECPY